MMRSSGTSRETNPSMLPSSLRSSRAALSPVQVAASISPLQDGATSSTITLPSRSTAWSHPLTRGTTTEGTLTPQKISQHFYLQCTDVGFLEVELTFISFLHYEYEFH